MNDRGSIRSIKFSQDNQILAVQRRENAVEFILFQGEQPQLNDLILYQTKALIYGFVWVHTRECALISNAGVEIFTVIPEKKQLKSIKALSVNIKWFAWCSETNIALLCSPEMNTLTPVIIKQKTITKLPKLDRKLSFTPPRSKEVDKSNPVQKNNIGNYFLSFLAIEGF